MPEITLDHAAVAAEDEAIEAVLSQHSDEINEPWDPVPFRFSLKDGDRVCGGLMGNINRGWMFVSTLAVEADLRGQGWGEKLIGQAEDLARSRGCSGIWLDTFNYQAPGFYEKIGFSEFGRLPNYPDDQIRYFFKKELI